MKFWDMLEDWIIPLGLLAVVVLIILWVSGAIGGGIAW